MMKFNTRARYTMVSLLLLSSPLTQAADVQAKTHQTSAIKPSSVHGVQTLEWKKKGESLITVTNTGNQTVRLERNVVLLPDEMPLTLEKTQLLPGETLIVYGACSHHLPQQKEIQLTPVSSTGQAMAPQTLPLH